MEFVSIKTPQQSHLLSLHRVRSRLVGQRTSSVLNFTTLDIQPGDWLKIGSQVASTGFAHGRAQRLGAHLGGIGRDFSLANEPCAKVLREPVVLR